MNLNAPSDHSNFIGGSNAAARIACPASWQMEQKLPPDVRKESSPYADDGSALHAAIANILNDNITDPQALLGTVYQPWTGYPITQDMINEALIPCLDFYDALDAEFDGIEFYVEKRVDITFLPGVFGTCDLIGRHRTGSVIIDWKFGVGVEVLAYYEDGDGFLTPNEQLMFYALGATYSHPEMFDMNDLEWPITLCIAQPRHRDGANFDRTTIKLKDLLRFQKRLQDAAAEAKSDNPSMAKGAHCRFMPCKSICPLHTGPLLDIPELVTLSGRVQLEAAVGGDTGGVVTADWGTTYGLMLDLAARIEPVIREWRTQAQAYLETGGTIPDYKLVNKRATRQWTKSEKSVERRLQRMGLDKNQRMPRSLVSPPQAEKLLKAIGKSLPTEYVDAISSGVTLARSSDPRQTAQSAGDLAASLATALASLRAGGTMKPETETELEF